LTVSIRLIPLEDRAAWTEALRGLEHAPAHTWAYRAAIARSREDPEWLFVAEAPGSRFVCPVAERTMSGEPDAYTPFGFAGPVGVGDADVFRLGWERHARDRGYVASYLGLHPELAPPALQADPDAAFQATTFRLDLGPEETILAGMASGQRARARRYPRLEPSITDDRERVAPWFVREYEGAMRARGASGVYDLSPSTLDALTRLEDSLLIGYPGEDLGAAALFTWSGTGAHWDFGIRPLGGPSLLPLVMHATRALRERGISWLNLGGGITEGDGVAAFKRELGASPMPFRALTLVHRPDAYARLSAEAGVTPDATGEGGRAYFPAYRAPVR
jgi:hypothetical protein